MRQNSQQLKSNRTDGLDVEIEVLKSDWITTSNQSNCMGDQVLEVSGTKFMPRCINSTDGLYEDTR